MNQKEQLRVWGRSDIVVFWERNQKQESSLGWAFTWKSSPEGDEYWRVVHQALNLDRKDLLPKRTTNRWR